MDGKLESVILENHQRFLAFLRSRVNNEQAAEDILQSAYARGLAKVDDLKDADKIIPWFYRLLRNAIIDHYRHAGVEKKVFDHAAENAPEPAEPVDPELERTVCRCVTALVDTLKPEYADALRKTEIDDVSVKDAAAADGITPGNLSVRLHRAREALKIKVLQTCGACASHGCVDCTCRHPL